MRTKRLGTTVFSTFLLLRKSLIIFIVLEVLLIAITAGWNSIFRGSGPLPGVAGEAAVAVFLFLTGMSFYEKHMSFCILNSVSRAERVISGVIASLGVSLAAAAVCTAARIGVYGAGNFSASIAKFIRIAIHTGLFPAAALPADLLELAVFWLAILWFGYFLGAVRQRIGGGKLLLVLFVIDVLFGGNFAWSMRTGFNPLMWVCLPAAYMQETRLTSMLLSLLMAVIFGFFGLIIKNEKISEG